jgi:hypothetical protein
LNTTPVQQGGTSAYLQTHTLGNNFGQSASVQFGIPDVGGTVHPYTWKGVKCPKAVFQCGVDEILTLTMTLDAKDIDTSTSLTSPVYQTANPPFHFAQGAVTKGAFGSETSVSGVRKATITLERPMETNRFYLAGSARKNEPVMNHFVKLTADIETDLLNTSDWDSVFINNSSFSLVLTFTGGAIPSGGANNFALTLNLSDCFIDSESPKVPGPGVIQPKLRLVGLFDDTHAGAVATLMTTDTSL